ncbi:MAG TPA: DUF4124 domain-containing protein [Gammaproteobacteria bacterium]|nr:DUF4124 domain-containing protein [Gammaproteobacteria bacterium]
MKLFYLLGTLLLCCTYTASAAVYTYIDANGERVYTDKPPQHQRVERIDIAPPNQLPAVPVIKPPPVYQDSAAPAALHYQILRILTPEPDATIRANDRQLIVTVSSEPALQEGHRYRLLLDGQPVAEPSRSPVFPIKDIDRGTHRLAVEIINEHNAVLERTPAQPFHLRQITLNDKRRVRPCTKDDYGVRPECPLKDKPKEKSSILPFFKS